MEHISHFHFFLKAVLSTTSRMGTSVLKGDEQTAGKSQHYTGNQTQIILAQFLMRSTSMASEHIIASWKTRLEGTSRIIWSNLSWQKHGLDKIAHHLLDLLPGLGSQMQDPEILVMIELFPVGRCKLPAKYPQLPASCGNHCRLPGEEGRAGSDMGSETRDRRPLSVKCGAASKY